MDVYDFNAISCIGYFSDMNLDIISNVSVGIGVVKTLLSPYFYSHFFTWEGDR
jgi:hypothetical protein